MEIEKKYHFYAAHRNKSAGIKCGRIHGHTYLIKILIKFGNGEINKQTGVTMLFQDIDLLLEPIIKKYDHYLLLYENDNLCKVLDAENEPYIKLPFVTSLENLAKFIYLEIKQVINITKLEISETLSSKVIYYES